LEIAWHDNKPEPIVGFDYDAIDGDDDSANETAAQAGNALLGILQWIVGDRISEPNFVAARAYALMLLLRPSAIKFESLNEIAKYCNCTRTLLPNSLMKLKDAVDCKTLMHWKREGSRAVYQESARDEWRTRLQRVATMAQDSV
jgi:hypothetical protein